MGSERVKESESCTMARKRGSEQEDGEERMASAVKAGSMEVREGKQREPP